jgi:hypothetical protein
MGAAFAVLLATLGVDAGTPRWLPRTRPVDLSEQGTYNLRRAGEGYIYDDARFEARIARDGVVTFKNKRGHITAISASLIPFLGKGPAPRGPTLESTIRDYLRKRRGGSPPPPEVEPPPPLPRKMEPSEVCPPSSSCYVRPLPTAIEVRGSFDLTDEIMRAHGQDPYAYEKARFLSATFEFRIQMAIEARKADLKSSLALLPERLDELLGDERYTARERRRILYELWYETDATAEGERAARAIEAAIRRRLPCGSVLAYPGEELEAFHALHPERRFPAAADCAPEAPEQTPAP